MASSGSGGGRNTNKQTSSSRGGRSGRGGRNNQSSRNTSRRNNTRNKGARASNKEKHAAPSAVSNNTSNLPNEDEEDPLSLLRDQDVLIAFAPHVRNEHSQALEIQRAFQASNDSKAFVSQARAFLKNQQQQQQHTQQQQKTPTSSARTNPPPPTMLPVAELEQELGAMTVSPIDKNKDYFGAVPVAGEAALLSSRLTPPVNASPSFMPPPPPGLSSNIPISSSSSQSQPSSLLFQQSPPSPNEHPWPSNTAGGEPLVTTTTVNQNSVPTNDNNDKDNVLESATTGAPTASDDDTNQPQEQQPTTPFKPQAAAAVHHYQPKRLWTRPDQQQQPGRVLANNVPFGHTVALRPRQEFMAQWMLPLKYIQEHYKSVLKTDKRKQQQRQPSFFPDALRNLTIGLFRRGCSDNISSIISKQVISSDNEDDDQNRHHRSDYPFQVKGDMVVGGIPFYSPRTPGNVVLRLYWNNDNEVGNDNNNGGSASTSSVLDSSRYTLATGPTMAIKVAEKDVEPTLRFILGNFKARKGAATSLSSLFSFALVLEQTMIVQSTNAASMRERWEGSKRATWGCLCESRKVYEACGREYVKTRDKLVKVEKEVHRLREQVEAQGEADDDLVEKLREKTSALMGGRASNERKWRDAQVVFASILTALTTNPSCQVLASRDLIARARLELELWCPLCESFAPNPFSSGDEESVYVKLDDFPHTFGGAQFRKCANSREEMQLESLGFLPIFKTMQQVLAPTDNSRRQGQPSVGMNPTAVGALNGLSAAMGELYTNTYMVSDRIHKQRELVRSHVNDIVARCDAFPPGTRVVVFGSAANGFGSPSSDLDMCLQLPPSTKLADEDDANGAKAMSKLAELFQEGGLEDVNTERLTARIPIVMFSCPRPLSGNDQDRLVECDLSMQNPLACLNTSLLLTYSQIHPITRVLASIIKRWAKSRVINSPSNHTLSTYGYILMLLHFLTYHKRKESGLVTTIDNKRNNRDCWTPLLPNLQWMDPRWPDAPPKTHYIELSEKPKQLLIHPLDQNDFIVNTYFYRLNDPATLSRLQQRFPGQDLSLSILLASFFRYYAYEFDYKRHVVSLNATASRGMVDREEKAELDCWKAFGSGLSIEDPFETFYDVAHVVKGSNFHRIRNEFAMAYTKIVCVATGQGGSWNEDVSTMSGADLIDWICVPFVKESPEEEEPAGRG